MLKILMVALAAVTASDSQPPDLNKLFKEGIPVSPFMNVVYAYADAILEHGRDVHGPQKTGLFLSALDRQTLGPLTGRPAAPAGIREEDRPGPPDRPLVGANPQLDENLLRLMYFLTDLSTNKAYAQAADEALTWFLTNTQSPQTGLLPWGEHLSWNVIADVVASGYSQPVHEFARPWMLWPECFELAPDASRKFAMGLWNSQIADHQTGAFNRHASLDTSAPTAGLDFARHAGFCIRTWAEAYTHTGDKEFLRAIDAMLSRYEKKRHPVTGLIESVSGSPSANAALSLSLAIDCDGAARKTPEPLRTRLRCFALREDDVFCSLPHDLKDGDGFALNFRLTTGKPDGPLTPLWDAGYGTFTTAAVAMMCVGRYHNVGKAAYRDLIIAAADAYMDSLPADDVDAWPMTFGHAISLELAAFAVTAQKEYHDRAFSLAETAVQKFFDNGPLPRASVKTGHYETITGADTLALALAQLHLSTMHITAVRAPVNTLDR